MDEDKISSHAELKRFFQEAVSHLLEADPLLSDLHPQVTLEEVRVLNELEHGRAMKVYVERADGGLWGVVVPREATVRDLKLALKKHVALALGRQGVRKTVSWKYIWRNYWLALDGESLKNDNGRLLDVGVRHKSSLSFLKRHRERCAKQLNRGGK
ncbi:U11/U12 small nuclear ribonucleoprotein 25 kDa protein-like [Scylla paramamosain]|uniref:U11/U12 small nuclear ribonucleoprotein 25 kDa protein-like n=1 Tax=Scylla paramamosain TaxID=85552 RepID=UPI003083D797